MHVCIYVYMYVCMYVCMHACMHACMHTCMSVWRYVCMYVRTYIRTYVRVCVCMYVCMLYKYDIPVVLTIKGYLAYMPPLKCFWNKVKIRRTTWKELYELASKHFSLIQPTIYFHMILFCRYSSPKRKTNKQT